MTTQLLTHSRLACYRSCPRKHFLRYELGLRPITDGSPLRVGSAFHAALEAYDKGTDPASALEAGLADEFEMAMVAAMVNGHRTMWSLNDLEVVATEQEFAIPLVNPETGAQTNVWQLAGKLDRIVRLPDGRLALMEYKTTSRDFAPGADYWLRLHMDQQLSLYMIAAREAGFDVQTVLYDVTRRPGMRPLKATPEDQRKYVKATGALYANQRDADETPDEYAARIAADIAARPDHYFARIEIARLDQDLEDCAAEIWQQQQAIREAQRTGRWYRNPAACIENFKCEYLNVCMNRDLEYVTPDGFTRSENVHPELGCATDEG